MAKKVEQQLKEPNGQCITKDKKRRLVYYNPFQNRAYYLLKGNYSDFSTYTNRYLVAFMFGILIHSFVQNIWLSLLTIIVIGGFMLYRFYGKVLPSLQECTNIDSLEHRCSKLAALTDSYDTSQLLQKGIITILFGVVSIVNAVVVQFNSASMIYACVLGVVVILFGIATLGTYMQTRKK